MKNYLVAVVLTLGVGCASTNPDPDNGVSSAQYRKSIQTAEDSIAMICTRIGLSRKADRTEMWWDAIIVNLNETRDQLHNTLRGSTK